VTRDDISCLLAQGFLTRKGLSAQSDYPAAQSRSDHQWSSPLVLKFQRCEEIIGNLDFAHKHLGILSTLRTDDSLRTLTNTFASAPFLARALRQHRSRGREKGKKKTRFSVIWIERFGRARATGFARNLEENLANSYLVIRDEGKRRHSVFFSCMLLSLSFKAIII